MHLKAVYLRIDTIEQGLRDLCGTDVRYEGYQLAHQIAAENLQMGNNVVCDSCNPLDLTRRDWEAVAIAIGVPYPPLCLKMPAMILLLFPVIAARTPDS